MAVYKVLQDIEAEDKLVGPLTFRQFVYAGISFLNLYLCFLVVTKGVPFMLIVFFPIAVLCGFFAWPWARDQPTEVWALAKIRFLLKPRRRIWDQSGMKELVTINAPRKIERVLTNGLTQNEVKYRLKALADTIDTRGWAIKNVNVNLALQTDDSDRLINMSTLPKPVSEVDVRASDDMLDMQNNPVAQQFNTMIAASAKAHRQEIIDRMQQATVTPKTPPPSITPPAAPQQPVQTQTPNDYWFLNQPTQMATNVPQDTVTFNTQVVAPGSPTAVLPVTAATPTADEEAFIKQHKNQPAFSPNMHGHLHVIQPLSAQGPVVAQTGVPQTLPAQPAVQNPPAPPVTQPQDTAILDLARNDDLNVATLAREARKRKEPPQDEVVISLH